MAKNDLIDQNHDSIDEKYLSSEHKSYKLYNFRRPDKFSKEHLKSTII